MNYTIEQFKADLETRYTSVGSYPKYFICADGGILSWESAKEEQELIISCMEDKSEKQWIVVGCDINWENDDLVCDHSGEKIERAYGD